MPLINDRRTTLAVMAGLALAPGLALAATHNVEMLNVHPTDRKKRMVYEPLILSVGPGDTIVFLPTDKGHNSQSTDGMIPDGAESWKSKINEEFSITLEQPGIYGYHCTPHLGTGMVGLILVQGDGMTDNLEAAQAVKHRGRAAKIWEEIWAQVEANNLLS